MAHIWGWVTKQCSIANYSYTQPGVDKHSPLLIDNIFTQLQEIDVWKSMELLPYDLATTGSTIEVLNSVNLFSTFPPHIISNTTFLNQFETTPLNILDTTAMLDWIGLQTTGQMETTHDELLILQGFFFIFFPKIWFIIL